jgi:phosphatidate phosphatase APP1
MSGLSNAVGGARRPVGVVSDIDSTIVPPHRPGEPLPAPYPGIAALLCAVDRAQGGAAGDVHYVTARRPARATFFEEYSREHGLPAGRVETRPPREKAAAEKVRDITRILETSRGDCFVLFGDTLQHDPEVYAQIREQHPEQVAAIVIHRVTPEVEPARVAGMHLVDDYAQAARALYADGILDEASAQSVIQATAE